MKTSFRAALISAAFVLLLPLTARSEVKAGLVEIEPFVGYRMFENTQNLKDRPVIGGRIGYNFTNRVGVEATLETVRSRVDDITKPVRIDEGVFGTPMNKVRVNIFNINGVYTFTPEAKFNPFITGGVGLVNYKPTVSTRTMGSLNVGVGAKYWMSDTVALRFDLMNTMATEFFQEPYHNLDATIGLSFALGGKGKPAAKVVAAPEVIVPKPEYKPAPVVAPPPKVVEPVVIFVSEPKVEEKVEAIVVQPKIEEKVIVFALEDAHFDFDSSVLTPEAQAILKRNILVLNKNPKAKVLIAGYTSASGTDDYNQSLSERRANAVRDYLVKENVSTPDRLSVIGYGEESPDEYEAVPKNLNSEAAKANMRVLFEIVVQ